MDALSNGLSAFLENLVSLMGTGFVDIVVGIVILVIGYLLARLLAGVVRRLLRRTQLDNRMARGMGDDNTIGLEDMIARIVFYVLMLFVMIIFFTRINLGAAAAPLQDVLDGITGFIPNLLAAAVLGIVAWVIATLARMVVTSGMNTLRVDERMNKAGALEDGTRASISQTVGHVVFYLILFLFLPLILGALEMEGLLLPVQDMFSGFLGYVPNIFGALLVFGIGYLVARVVRQIITNLLAAAGADSLGQRVGLAGSMTLSHLMGTLVYALILIPVVIQALDTLDIEAISSPATGMLTAILGAIPGIFGAAVVVAISYFVARLVSNLVADLLAGVGVNRLPEMLGLQMAGERKLSDLIGYVILVIIMLFAAVEAAGLLGFENVAGIIEGFVSFGGQVLLGIVILAIGLYFANLAHGLILGAGQSPALATIARVAILILAGAMGVRQMGLAEDIVNLAFGIMLGAIGVAAAIAFGFGSRELAGREVERFIAAMRGSQQAEIEE